MAASISLLRGKAGVLLGCAKAAPVGRGHEHPHGKKNRLRSGHDVGEARICQDHEFPRHCRMFMAHLHRWALAFLGFWVRRLLRSARRNWHRVSLRACQTESRRSKGQVRVRARCRPIARLIVV